MQNKFMLFFAVSLLFSLELRAEEHGHEHEEEHEQIVLSSQVIENYGIELSKISTTKEHLLPRTAVVNAQGEYFIYLKEGEGFEQVEISPIRVDEKEVLFSSDELKKGDEVVNVGAKYLRVILLDKEGGEVGHAH